ncbi:cyclophilin peptidyl-prolyl cis-trans isomerase Cyp8, partial [Coemansia sp. RSA 2705]
MGRGKDKLFITQGEWSNTADDGGGMRFGGKDSRIQGKQDAAQSLAFDCCALSLKPFTTPLCTPDGYVFDAPNITEYVAEHHKHPFTDAKLEPADLIKLTYHQDANGSYVDPVTLKQFSEFTKIAANRRSGHVYLWSTLDEFNVKPGSWTDLVTGEPFERSDIIVLQDPAAPNRARKPAKRNERLERPRADAARPAAGKQRQPYNAAKHSKGLAAAALTSTAVAPVTANEPELIDEDEYMFARIKSKGYVRLATSLGDLNLELHCDRAPRTCFNFVKLARAGYYDGSKFHRSIRRFMIQGGDPTGTGRGGKSCWGAPFKDEVVAGKRLSHRERGVLSMANSGPDTNTSQFFITYAPARHLDGKHTVFGRVVGGLPVLAQMEAVPTDAADRPQTDIVISKATVFVDPYAEFAKRIERRAEHQRSQDALAQGKRRRTAAEEEQLENETTTWFGTKVRSQGSAHRTGDDTGDSGDGVGKYLKKTKLEIPASA